MGNVGPEVEEDVEGVEAVVARHVPVFECEDAFAARTIVEHGSDDERMNGNALLCGVGEGKAARELTQKFRAIPFAKELDELRRLLRVTKLDAGSTLPKFLSVSRRQKWESVGRSGDLCLVEVVLLLPAARADEGMQELWAGDMSKESDCVETIFNLRSF